MSAGPDAGHRGSLSSLLVDHAGRDWLSATMEACPARNTAPLIERDVSRRSPGWYPVRCARPPARRRIPRHRRRWRWACLPRSAGCTSTTTFRSRWAVPTARPGCCPRRSATGARPSQEYTEQPVMGDWQCHMVYPDKCADWGLLSPTSGWLRPRRQELVRRPGLQRTAAGAVSAPPGNLFGLKERPGAAPADASLGHLASARGSAAVGRGAG